MDSLKLLITSFIQGITELLPISSSGHILLLGNFLNIEVTTLLLTSLHIGTTIAVIIFFRKELQKTLFSRNNRVILINIALASVLPAVIGFLFEDYIEERLRFPWITSVSLIFWGLVMMLVERFKKKEEINLSQLTLLQTFLIGASQCLALIPGTSRSGITTITGVLLGLGKYESIQFGFLLGLPILIGSSTWSVYKEISHSNLSNLVLQYGGIYNILILFCIPLITGLISLHLLKKIKKENWLTIFGIYRIILGILILFLEYGS